MGTDYVTDYIIIQFAPLAALGGSGGSNLIKLVFLGLVSGIFLAGASIALVFSPIRNDLPCIVLSINFAFKILRVVQISFTATLATFDFND